MLRKKGVVGKFVEFFGPGLDRPVARGPRDDRQHGAGIRRDLRLLPGRRRDARLSRGHRPRRRRASRWSRPTPRRRACGATPTRPTRSSPTRSSSISPTVEPSLAGPKRPQDRVAARRASPSGFADGADRRRSARRDEPTKRASRSTAPNYDIGHGDVVIAAITCCTNTSNPTVLIAAGLLARKARRARASRCKPWVKTSLAPGSQVVTDYLAKAGLQKRSRRARLQPRRLWLHHLHRQFRPAARRDRRGDRRRRPGRRRGAFRQPQLRGPRQPACARQLSRLAAAGRRLCARRLDARRPDDASRSARQGRQAGLSQGHLADATRRSPTIVRKCVTPRDVPHALRRRVQGRRSTGRRSRSTAA